jgi:YVTN family beta-propeller protein
MRTNRHAWTCAALASCGLALACGDDGDDSHGEHGHDLPHALFVTEGTTLAAYDIETGAKLPGTFQNLDGATDLTVLRDGTLITNLTERNEVLVADGVHMQELDRIESSAGSGTRPVHGYLTPDHDGQYWMVLNDGDEGDLGSNSARFIDVETWEPLGEVALGMGHHKASFGVDTQRVVISNIGDCDTVLGVYDFTDPSALEVVATVSAAQLGYDGSTREKTCDATRQAGAPLSPHGCATASATGKAYCNLTGPGDIVEVDIDADEPSFRVIEAAGSGAGYSAPSDDGRYIYTLQTTPREDQGGEDCQVGQLVIIDSMAGEIASELPLLYKGPGCTDKLVGTDEESAGPGHIVVAGDTVFITPAGGFGMADARVRFELIVDASDKQRPVQLESLPIAAGTGHVNDALSGDGKYLFVAGTSDDAITQIDVARRSVVKNIEVGDNPTQVETYGSKEGPSHQTGPHH